MKQNGLYGTGIEDSELSLQGIKKELNWIWFRIDKYDSLPTIKKNKLPNSLGVVLENLEGIVRDYPNNGGAFDLYELALRLQDGLDNLHQGNRGFKDLTTSYDEQRKADLISPGYETY